MRDGVELFARQGQERFPVDVVGVTEVAQEEITVSVSLGADVDHFFAVEAALSGRAGAEDRRIGPGNDGIGGAVVIEDVFDEAGVFDPLPVEVGTENAAGEDDAAEHQPILRRARELSFEEMPEEPGAEAMRDEVGVAGETLYTRLIA